MSRLTAFSTSLAVSRTQPPHFAAPSALRFSPFLLFLTLLAPLAFAQSTQPSFGVPDFTDVGLTERLGNPVPLDVTFDDDTGRTIHLRDFFNQGRPVVLQVGYYACPRLCGEVSRAVVDSLKQITFRAGKDYDFVFLSINPSETSRLAHLKKQSYLDALSRPDEAAGWHFLTGKNSHIRQVADAVGFRYKWIEDEHQFVHPSGIIVLAPDGRVSRYLNGIEFDPKTLRMSLVEASQGKIGSVSDKIWLVCFQYSSHEGKYVIAATRIMQTGAVLTVLILAVVIGRLLRREFAQRQALPPSPGPQAS